MKTKYYLSCKLGDETVEREVTKKEWIKAERGAGFYPKLSSDDPSFMEVTATGGFTGGSGISGRIECGDDI